MNRIYLIVHGVLLGFGAIAGARADEAPIATAPQTPDTRILAYSDLKYRVLEAEALLETSLHSFTDESASYSRLYVGDGAAAFSVKGISIAIDGGIPAAESFDDDEAQSLAGTGDLHLLKDVRLAAGAHELHVEMQIADLSKPQLAPQILALDHSVELDSGESVELELVPSTLLSAAHIEVIRHKSDNSRPGWFARTFKEVAGRGAADIHFTPGLPDDPDMRYVRHLVRMGQSDAAVVELLRISQGIHDNDRLPAEFWLQLSSALRQANLPDQAQAVCDRLDAEHAEHQAVGVERLRIGILQYDLGDLAKARAQLLSAQGRLPQYRVQDWQVAYAQILFASDEEADARRVLQSGNVDSDDAFRYMLESNQAVLTSAYRRFNLAVAMVRSGDVVRGLSLLDLVGRLKSNDSNLLALRDKANLALGWHFLRERQGATAMGLLGRVRSEGQYSDSALLGMGWAELEPGGNKLSRTRLSETTDSAIDSLALPAPMRNSLTQLGVLEAEMRGEVGPKRFKQYHPPANREEGLRRALNLWTLLAGRDSRESAVQESLLATAYAFDELNDYASARGAYARAIAALEQQKNIIAEGSDFIRTGGFSGSIARAGNESELAIAMDRLHLVPDDNTQALYASIGRYRDLERLQRGLATHAAELSLVMSSGALASSQLPDLASSPLPDVAALLADLDTDRQSEVIQIQSRAEAELNRRRSRIEDYLKVAYFAAAHDADFNLTSTAR